METIIDVATYNNVKTMLESPDAENHVIALQLIEQLDFNKNLSYILLFKKYATCDNDLWKENAPSIFNKLSSICAANITNVYTFKDIFETLAKEKVHKEQFDNFFKIFAQSITDRFSVLGYDFIDKLEITIKLKDE